MTDESHPFITGIVCAHCGTPLKVRIHAGPSDRTCPVCRKKWFGYHFGTILEIVSKWKAVYFMTLTLRNIPDRAWSRGHVRELRANFGKLRRRFKSILGGFYCVQTTNCGKGWHLHLHVLFDGAFIPQKVLSATWAKITGGSWIVGIELVQDRRKAVGYLLRDFLQAPKIRPEDAGPFNSVFRGARLVQPFGKYRNVKFRVPFACPRCGRVEWILLDVLLGGRRSFRREWDKDDP